MDTHLLRNRPAYTLDRETAPDMWLVGTLWLIQATGVQTGNRSSFLEQVMPRGLGPPTHRHPLAIEGFYVVEGTVSFHVLGKKVRAEAGTLIHLPRMIPHSFTIESEEARVINFYAPAGAEIQVMCLAHAAGERRRPTMEESLPPKSDELNQILSRLYGSVGVTALPFSVQPTEALLITKPDVWEAGSVKVARAAEGPAFEAFGLQWRVLAAGMDTEDNYDLFEVSAGEGAGMPLRILGADEAIYVISGAVTVESAGQSVGGGVGSFTYMTAGSVVSWQAAADARLLIFHFPDGFDRALAGGLGHDALVVAWLESTGTRFLAAMPLTQDVLDTPGGGRRLDP
jgi:quercetin dioxygenase-like cupin family protein